MQRISGQEDIVKPADRKSPSATASGSPGRLLCAAGPGRYSLDGLTGLRLPRALTGLVVAGVAINLAMVLRAAPPQPAPVAPAPAAPKAGTDGEVTR
jgi:hypothetical protein